MKIIYTMIFVFVLLVAIASAVEPSVKKREVEPGV